VSALFPGEARPLPAGSSRGTVTFGYTFREGEGRPLEPVRHAVGYEQFVAFATATGTDPALLAGSLAELSAFVRTHREALADPALAEAAAVFLGNVLAVVHPRAAWRMTNEPEVGTDAVSMPVRAAFASMRDDPAFGPRMAADLPTRWAEADARNDDIEAAMVAVRAATIGASLAEVPEFVPPLVATGPFLDARGAAIPYGERWDHPAGPPDDAYSRVTHPERFAPLIDATEALIAHLERHYDVETDWTDEEERTATLRPRLGAPIRIRFTDFPAVRLQVGLLLRETLPDCGCDACDEVAATAIESLVSTVLGVVAGGFAERVPGADGAGATSLRLADGRGTSSGGSELPEAADRLVTPEAVIALGGGPWPAWPRRT
jgi:hypothetical protein